jgi:PAS domain S-box-containing protein
MVPSSSSPTALQRFLQHPNLLLRVLEIGAIGLGAVWIALTMARWMLTGSSPSWLDLLAGFGFVALFAMLWVHYRLRISQRATRFDAQNRQLEDALSAMSEFLMVLSVDGLILRVNQAVLTSLGYTRQQMVNQPLGQFLMYAGSTNAISQVLRERARVRQTRSFRTASGQLLPMSLTYTPMHDADGNLYAVLCMAHSLSEVESMRAQLHTTNQRYNAAITSSRLAVFEYDPNTNQLVVDSSLSLLISGQSGEIRTLEDALTFIPLEDHNKIYTAINHVTSGKIERIEIEVRANSVTRGLRWLMVRGAINEQDGRLFGTLMDVTDRKVTEESLENRDQIMRTIAHASEVFLHATDWENHIDQLLEELGRAAGVSRVYVFRNYTDDQRRLISTQVAEWCAPGIEPQIHNPILQAVDLVAEGFERWVRVLGSNSVLHGVVDSMPPAERSFLQAQSIQSILVAPIFVNDAWWGYIGFDECNLPHVWQQPSIDALQLAADILGAAIFRGEVDKELEAGREFILNIMNNLGQGVKVINAQGRYVYVNPAYAQMIGLPPEEILGKLTSEFTRHDEVSASEGAEDIESSYITHLQGVDGHVTEVLVTSVPRVIDGRLDGAYCVVADISERRRLEQQRFELLLEQERVRLMSGFIRDMSHEFRTPLSIIQTSLYLLRRKPDHPQAHTRLDTIGAQAARLNRLVDDMMLMLELEQAEIVPRALSLNTMAAHVMAQSAPKAEQKKLTLSLEQPSGDISINGEEGYLARAAMMLVDNAIEFTPEGGSITLCVTRDATHAQLIVRDTGVGIPKDELENIFEHMYKVDKARNTERGGLGLGLSIVRRIAVLHGGHVEVESEEGKGSMFVLKIPYREPPKPITHQTLTQEVRAVLVRATDEVGRVDNP